MISELQSLIVFTDRDLQKSDESPAPLVLLQDKSLLLISKVLISLGHVIFSEVANSVSKGGVLILPQNGSHLVTLKSALIIIRDLGNNFR